jgi:hypothetical protein
MSRADAISAVQAASNRKLRQHPAVQALVASGAVTKPPLSVAASMRSALGLLDDDGHIDKTIIVRACDPGDADDHRHYWPLTVRRRWRWNGQGLDLDLTASPTESEYEIIADAICEEVRVLEVKS